MTIVTGKPLILFDGFCHLCCSSVQFILKYDRKKQFIFSPLSGELGKRLQKELGISANIDSIILVEGNTFLVRSEAILKIAKLLGGFFTIASVFSIFPKNWLDKCYDWVAAHRTNWFAKRGSCMMPKPENKDRFL